MGSMVEMSLPTGPKLVLCSKVQSQGIKQTSDSFLKTHVSFSHVSVINTSRNRRADVMFEIKKPLGDLMQASLMPCYSGTAG